MRNNQYKTKMTPVGSLTLRCMKLKKLFLIFCIACYAIPGHSQALNISLKSGKFQIDEAHSMIVARINDIQNFENLSHYSEVTITLGEEEYSFNTIPTQLQYSSSYEVGKGEDEYTLYFTELPLISITAGTIKDDPKTQADFTYSDDKLTFTSYIGIEIRGGYSMTFPKKTFDIEFWEDKAGNTTKSVSFGDLRIDDDWILDALYNEPLRIRSYLAHNLWLEIHQPHYLDIKPFAKAGADVIFVEVFLNGKYNGVYILSEQVDKKQLQIQGYNGMIRGELYKAINWGGACTFDWLPSYTNSSRLWGGYEYKIPDESEVTNWDELYNFTDFVINSSTSDFKEDIWNRFNKENAMDYYIYLNLIRAEDNTGKNIFMGKIDVGESYFYTPWDLDACFGTDWKGENDTKTNNILTNGFFRRSYAYNAGGFKTDVGNRWHAYRNNILSTESLETFFDHAYNTLINNNVYDRESIVYPNYDFSASSYDYMISWLNDRLTILDSYFVESEISSSFTESQNQNALIYPNPADDYIQIKLQNEITDANYSIFDLTGKLILQGTIFADERIDIRELSSGIYFIKLGQTAHKLLIN
jgi:spore coat protein H